VEEGAGLTDWDDTTHVAKPPPSPPRRTDERAYLIVLAGANVGEMHRVTGDSLILGRAGGADVRLVDEGISRFHCRIRAEGPVLLVEDLQSRNGTFLNGRRVEQGQLADGDKIQLGRTTVLKFSLHDPIEESFQRRMFDSALRDGLTRAYNRRYFLDRLDTEVRFALRHRSPLGLLLFDLDHFKRVNDEHGHQAGDRVLAEFAALILDSIRHEDVFARYGGEEFAVLSRLISSADCARFAERLRRSVDQIRVPYEESTLSITVSIGVACIPELSVQDADELLRGADRALYQAKASGRNRVVSCRPEMLEDGDPARSQSGPAGPAAK
jgi:diguanylate cyclase (GGDEF)-like protein